MFFVTLNPVSYTERDHALQILPICFSWRIITLTRGAGSSQRQPRGRQTKRSSWRIKVSTEREAARRSWQHQTGNSQGVQGMTLFLSFRIICSRTRVWNLDCKSMIRKSPHLDQHEFSKEIVDKQRHNYNYNQLRKIDFHHCSFQVRVSLQN